MTYIYPLRNLTTDIQKQLESFFSHISMVPKRIITDFDLKLIGGKAREYLNSMLGHVNAALSYRQDKNGLAERHWQTLVSMARNWLVSAELPPSFWFYAVKRAAEVCNYIPLKLEDNSFTTPFELAHHQKPDLRTLFKPFCLVAVRRERVGDETLSKFTSQSIPMITIGRCPNLDGLQFLIRKMAQLCHQLTLLSNLMSPAAPDLATNISQELLSTDWMKQLRFMHQLFLWTLKSLCTVIHLRIKQQLLAHLLILDQTYIQ